MKIELTGEVATLRPLGEADAEAYTALLDENRGFLKPFEPAHSPEYWTLDQQRALLRQSTKEFEARSAFIFGIIAPDGELAGRVALNNVVWKAWQNANLGYWVDRAHNGRGLATDAVKLVLRFAFEMVNLHRVEAGVMPRNKASIRVLEKAGFRTEGLAVRYLLIDGAWEDHQLFALTNEEWGAR
jgi:ribosomal-protein-alanine N-acetyltransferase